MSDEIIIEGLGLASGVLETIVSIATEQVPGVACVCNPGLAGLVGKANKAGSRLIEVGTDDSGAVTVAVHIQAEYGAPLREIAGGVQASIADAMRSQVGAEVASVDVFIDGIVFES